MNAWLVFLHKSLPTLCYIMGLSIFVNQECEVERDVYAAEICRLQKVVKRLKALQLKISNENREFTRLKDKASRLKLANQRLESCILVRTQGKQFTFELKMLDEPMKREVLHLASNLHY